VATQNKQKQQEKAMNTKITVGKGATKVEPKKAAKAEPAKPEKVEAPKAAKPEKAEAREVKSMTAAFVPSEKLDKNDKTRLKAERKNEAREGTARHAAIAAAQACKTMGELRGKLAANWISWLVREKYVVAAD
jgi:hypothetical protein